MRRIETGPMTHDEFRTQLKDMAKRASDALRGVGEFKKMKSGHEGGVALYLLCDLVEMICRYENTAAGDGK